MPTHTQSDASPTERPTLRRVLRISRLNGLSIVFIAGASTVLSVLFGDWLGAVVAGAVTAAGWSGLRGNKRLRAGDDTGMALLWKSEAALLAIIWLYCGAQLVLVRIHGGADILSEDVMALLGASGLSAGDVVPLVQMMLTATYAILLAVTLVYQGGLCVYYRRRVETVRGELS
ncbi:MAG: hypothetical protein ACJAYU_003816 [Bradymonadia bacterium]|jgi:hypothetical protein